MFPRDDILIQLPVCRISVVVPVLPQHLPVPPNVIEKVLARVLDDLQGWLWSSQKHVTLVMRDPWLGVTDFVAVLGPPLVALGRTTQLHGRDVVFHRLGQRSDAVPPRPRDSLAVQPGVGVLAHVLFI